MPGGLPGGGAMLKLRFDWYITPRSFVSDHVVRSNDPKSIDREGLGESRTGTRQTGALIG